jgi:hypothetical protein
MAGFQTWLADHRARAGSKSPLGQAQSYIATHREGLQVFPAAAASRSMATPSSVKCVSSR